MQEGGGGEDDGRRRRRGGASDIYSISSHYRNWVFPHVSRCAYWVLDTGGGGSLNMAAASDAPQKEKKSRLNNTEFAATDGQDGYNEARRCQWTAPDWWDWCLRGGQGVRRKNEAEAAFAARLFATSCLRSSCPNCCLAWRLRSLGTPFMPPLNTSARKERDCYCHYSR